MQPRRTFRGVTTVVSVVCSVVVLTGCAALAGNQKPVLIGAGDQGVTLSVFNRNFEDVRVYMLRGETQVPLGTVAGMQSRVFRISRAKLGFTRVLRLAMVATPSRYEITMIPVDVGPGQMVEARVGTHFNNSYAFAR